MQRMLRIGGSIRRGGWRWKMLLYVARHGQANSKIMDPQQHLSPWGQADIAKMARFLKQQGVGDCQIWHSTLARAAETARIFAETLTGGNSLLCKEGLQPNDPIQPVARAILDENKDLLLISHLPLVEDLLEELLGKNTDSFGFMPGTIVCLERLPDYTFQWKWARHPTEVNE